MKTEIEDSEQIKVYSHEELSKVIKELEFFKNLTLEGVIQKVLNTIDDFFKNSNHKFVQFYTTYGTTYYVFRVNEKFESIFPALLKEIVIE